MSTKSKFGSTSRFRTVITKMILVGWVILMAGCTPQQADGVYIGDGGFLSGEPCGPPCFWSITPGASTEAQVLEVLQEREISERCQTFNDVSEFKRRGVSCAPGLIFDLDTDTGLVSMIGFSPSQVVSVGEAIAMYGDPDAVLVTATNRPEQAARVVMALYFDLLNTEVVLPGVESATYIVSSITQIDNIGYLSEKEYKESNSGMHEFLSEWKGYGEYNVQSP